VTQFEEPAGPVDGAEGAGEVAGETAAAETAAAEAGQTGTAAETAAEGPSVVSSEPEEASPMAAALAQLDTLPQRELAEHPEVYQRIHAELQSALATIDNA